MFRIYTNSSSGLDKLSETGKIALRSHLKVPESFLRSITISRESAFSILLSIMKSPSSLSATFVHWRWERYAFLPVSLNFYVSLKMD